MRAIDVGVGHDDDPVVAQIAGIAVLADATAQRQRQVGDFLVRPYLVGGC